MRGRTSLTMFPGMHLSENTFINIKNHSFTVTVRLGLTEARPNGVLLAQAGRFGGWATYLDRGVPVFTYNFLGTQQYRVRARRALRRTETEVVFDFAYDGGAIGSGGTVTIRAGGEEVGSGRIERTEGYAFSLDETADVGEDTATPVDAAYGFPPANAFRGGTIEGVTIEVR